VVLPRLLPPPLPVETMLWRKLPMALANSVSLWKKLNITSTNVALESSALHRIFRILCSSRSTYSYFLGSLAVLEGSYHLSRSWGSSLISLRQRGYYQSGTVWNVASWSVVKCIVRCVVSVGNVFRSGSSSERHHSKCTASRAPQRRLPFRAAKVTRH
jgi:hypothetical protein